MKFNLFVAVLFSAVITSCNQGDQQSAPAVSTTDTPIAVAPSAPVITNIDEGKLLGSWVRTDSPYEIRILEVRSDGNILAGYFNPSSINVGRANWSKSDAVLSLYVELQDRNYPGSNYVLRYLPDQDVLMGKYFQAVEGATYDVAFSRKQ